MSRRRGNGEGTIGQRTDGRWEARVSLDDGRRKSYFGKTRAEVARKLAAALKARQDGSPVVGERLTVRQYLTEWLESSRSTVGPGTWERYESLLRIHALPYVGSIRLARLTPQNLQKLYAERVASGLSPTTVGHLHAVLHRALAEAARFDLVRRNVASLVKRPRAERHEMTTLSPEQCRALLEAARGDRLEALYVLAISTGMRQGEMLALRWPEVDLEQGNLRVIATVRRTRDGIVFGEPKTLRSRRRVQLTSKAITALRAHRARQIEDRLARPYWQDESLVFASNIGTVIGPQNLVRHSFYPLLDRAGLPRIRFHDLRHTAATLLLSQNVHPKVVSEMLGHSQIAVTLDLYSHVTPTMQQQATEALEAVLGA